MGSSPPATSQCPPKLDFDTIVIGAGIMGSGCAYKIAQTGRRTLLLEQFSLDHKLGSSHGASRIIRLTHSQPHWVPLAQDAYREWDQLHALDGGEPLYIRNGLLTLDLDWAQTRQRAAVLRSFGVPHEVLRGGAAIRRRFPHLCNYGEEWSALYEPGGGTMLAEQCLRTVQKHFLALGNELAQIRDNEQVLDILPTDNNDDDETPQTIAPPDQHPVPKRQRRCWVEVRTTKMNPGNCTRAFTRFYFDSTREQCHKFIYTGCAGNANRFLSRHQCKRRCHPKFRRRKNHQRTRVSATLTQHRRRHEHRQRQQACMSNCTNGVCMHGVCQCKKGFEWRGTQAQCVDSNECNWAQCAEHARCMNLPGSFRCECRPGFAGSGFNCTKNSRICAQWFDSRYERQCQPEQEWLQRFHYHLPSGECRPFWYGGCQFGESQNFFQDQQSCEQICGGYSHKNLMADFGSVGGGAVPDQAKDSELYSVHQNDESHSFFGPCMDPFDESLRTPCTEGIWKRRYYYDPTISRCRVFWMDMSCPSPRAEGTRSRNIFVHMSSCRRACREVEGIGMMRREKQDQNRENDGDEEEQEEEWRWREWDLWRNGAAGRNRKTGVIQASFTNRIGEEEEGGTTKASSTEHSYRAETTTASPTTVSTTEMPTAITTTTADDCTLVHMTDQLEIAKSVEEKKQRLAALKAKLRGMEEVHGQHKLQQKYKPEQKQHKGRQSGACFDPFDWALTRSCGKGPWRARFFYDTRLGKCRPFWNDGCRSKGGGGRRKKSRNNFRDEATCRRKCEREPEPEATPAALITEETGTENSENGGARNREGLPICAQPFDVNYQRACNNGREWRRRWYFDARIGFCRHFWSDGCEGKSRNIFDGLKECMDLCVQDNNQVIYHHQPDPALRQHLSKTENGAMALANPEFAYFAGGETGFWASEAKNFLQSGEIELADGQCTGFRYNASGGKALVRAFLCLMEEGGGCQRSINWATDDGGERCHVERPWLKGRHSYAWFFTLERRPNFEEPIGELTTNDRTLRRRRISSAVLTLRQAHLNTTNSALMPVEQFGTESKRQNNGNGTTTPVVVWVDLMAPTTEHCHNNTSKPNCG